VAGDMHGLLQEDVCRGEECGDEKNKREIQRAGVEGRKERRNVTEAAHVFFCFRFVRIKNSTTTFSICARLLFTREWAHR
jgi:hypothetical protein